LVTLSVPHTTWQTFLWQAQWHPQRAQQSGVPQPSAEARHSRTGPPPHWSPSATSINRTHAAAVSDTHKVFMILLPP